MQREAKEIIKLTAREILLTFCDFSAKVFFQNNSFYRHAVKKYLQNREADKRDFNNKIYYLKKQGYIRSFVERKKKYVELTAKGRKKIQKLSLNEIKIKRPKKWDGKWRVVIFDIPKKFKNEREVFRQKIKNLDFVCVQKSVYIHPFKCTSEIEIISRRLGIKRHVLIMISDIIQSEKEIIGKFIDKELLNKSDLVGINKNRKLFNLIG